MACHQKRGGFEQRATDTLAFTGGVPLAQRSESGRDPEHRPENIDDRCASANRLPDRACHVGQPALKLHHLIERGSVLQRACEIAFQREINQSLVKRLQLAPATPELVHRARPIVLQHDIGIPDQPMHDALPVDVLEIDGQDCACCD